MKIVRIIIENSMNFCGFFCIAIRFYDYQLHIKEEDNVLVFDSVSSL